MDDTFQTPLLSCTQRDSYFYVTPQELEYLFRAPNIHDGTSLIKLKELGGIHGVSQKLRGDLVKGLDIINNSEETVKRKENFGQNLQKQHNQKSTLHYICQKLQDQVLRFLFVSSIIYLIICKLVETKELIIEGYAILIVILFVIGIGAWNDHVKDKLFRIIDKKGQEKYATVFRQGRVHIIDAKEILVGDILEIKSGEKVPVDGILFVANSKVIIENSLSQELDKLKTPETGFKKEKKYDPFILSGSRIIQGSGIILVTCVGEYSYQQKYSDKNQTEVCSTPLQDRLEEIAEQFALPSLILSILIVIGFFIIFSYECFYKKNFI